MSNDEQETPLNSYFEMVFTNTDHNLIFDKHKSPSIRWYEGGRDLSSMYEAQEYVSSEIYSEILNNYDGYKTTDPKLAYSLLFLLIQGKTTGYITREVHAAMDRDSIENKTYYLVWMSP